MLIDISSSYSFLVIGLRNIQRNDDPLLFIIDSSGAIIDLKEYENVELTSFIKTSDGGCIILGTNNNSDWIIKTDVNGNIIWSKINEGRVIQTIDEGFLWIFDNLLTSISVDGDTSWSKYFEGINWVQQNDDEGYLIKTNSGNLIKTNNNGNIEWEKVYRDSDGDFGILYRIRQTDNNGYIIVGSTTQGNKNDILLMKTDSEGNTSQFNY